MNMIPIDNIVVGKRLRQVRPEAVESLAQSIQELGLLNPVLVTPASEDTSRHDMFRLIAGNHRMEACKRLGMREIAANIITTREVDQRLAEIDENLCRAELTHLERAEHLAERKALYEMKYPQTKQGAAGANKRWDENANEINSFALDTAQKTGSTERSIQKAVRRANNISQEVRDAIRDVASISDNSLELDALACLEEPQQKAAVQAVMDGKARSIREFLRQKEDVSRHPSDHSHQSRGEPEHGDGQTSPCDLQGWKRKAKEASGQVLAQKERIRTLNKERVALKARIKELETHATEPSLTPSPDLLAEAAEWQRRALKAEEECTNLHHRLGELERLGATGSIDRGRALGTLLDELETALCTTPEGFLPSTLNTLNTRFLHLTALVQETMRQTSQPLSPWGE